MYTHCAGLFRRDREGFFKYFLLFLLFIYFLLILLLDNLYV
jgi:hypothetical protein